jgi:hypothetical protein
MGKASVMRPGRQQRGRAGRRTTPKGACVVIFHVRDAAPVKELVDAMHSEWKRSKLGRRRSGRTPSRKGSRARASDHPPVFMPDDDHLIYVAPSRRPATIMRRTLERVLGDAVEHAVTRVIKAPPAAGRAAPGRRR